MNTDELIKQYCKKLRLGKNLYENYPKIQASDHADFLAQLLRTEIEHRNVVLRNRNPNVAGFEMKRGIAEYWSLDIQKYEWWCKNV